MYFKHKIHQAQDIYLIFFKISCDFENFLRTNSVGSQGKYQPAKESLCITKWLDYIQFQQKWYQFTLLLMHSPILILEYTSYHSLILHKLGCWKQYKTFFKGFFKPRKCKNKSGYQIIWNLKPHHFLYGILTTISPITFSSLILE